MYLIIFLQIQKNPLGSALSMFILMFLVFYFFMIRPQIRRQKSEKKFQIDLKKGDLIVTNGGLHGKIFEIFNEICIIETLNGKLKIERSSISKQISSLRYPNKEIKNKKEIKSTV